ncbi:hypothetical protein BTH42_00630 [Burkholderia sp. SRS-W-2-2016]|uniref:hypothetical protein n=1 Tax=Burkholderia sp. SRS-W-2-2016 TaxID=1926878 RepID=UPI00094AE9C8|nr:hypothetical protein [Burkholderia sp. SRS-W-2-2016]OLL33534.1 hypothetical protein BTH42_00630 [Burkholderia sp. SRS-W-2-2016]
MYSLALNIEHAADSAQELPVTLPWLSAKIIRRATKTEAQQARALVLKRARARARAERRTARIAQQAQAAAGAASLRQMLAAWDAFQAEATAQFEERARARRVARLLPDMQLPTSFTWQSAIDGITSTSSAAVNA